MKLVEEGSIGEAITLLKRLSPRAALVDYRKIKGNMIDIREDVLPYVYEFYPESDFVMPSDMKGFDGQRKVLVMIGKTNTGKSEFLKSYYAGKFGAKNVLILNHLEGLKDLTENIKVIIFDDVSFEGLTAEDLLGLLSLDRPVYQRVLYGAKRIKRGVERAVISNKSLESLFGF